MKYSESASLTSSQIGDLRFAASKMNRVDRRSFQAEMTLKYCEGKARLAETRFGWGRESVELALAEKRTGIRLWVPNPGTRVQNGGKTSTQKPLQYYEFSQMLSPNKNPRFRVVLPIRA